MRILFILFLCLFTINVQAQRVNTFTCTNADVDASEPVCGAIKLEYKYSGCLAEMTVGTAALTDFDISFTTRSGIETLFYSVSADYNTPIGYLNMTTSDLTGATVGTHLFELTDIERQHSLQIDAAGTSSTVDITLTCTLTPDL